jgi:acetyltransferase-like isoleucine patch superfamily enzyme
MIAYRKLTVFLFYKKQEIMGYFWSFFLRGHLHLLGVKTGSNVVFFGYTKFILSKRSFLRIGNGVVFRSSRFSNLIGLNRGCIITLMSDEAELTIGNHSGFSGTVIGCYSKIELGNNVRCGANTLITDSDWHVNDSRSSKPAPIIIEDNVWLGTNVTVLKGVRIGKNSVIGAGSLVSRDIPENVVAAGSPCKVIRSLDSSSATGR